jgi:ankyrin repeat protein
MFISGMGPLDNLNSRIPTATSLEQKIISADINALKSFIQENSHYLENPESEKYRNEAFVFAVKQGKFSVVELLLKEIKVDASFNDNEAIITASRGGHTEIVRMLLERREVNPGARDNEAIISASYNGHTEIIQLLLQRSDVNPSARNTEAIIMATYAGKTEVVPKLL